MAITGPDGTGAMSALFKPGVRRSGQRIGPLTRTRRTPIRQLWRWKPRPDFLPSSPPSTMRRSSGGGA